MINILAISGSLRNASSNTALLCAACALVSEGVEIELYCGLGNLPLFNPDLEGSEPSSVLDFRTRLKEADGVMIASPEYAHGVTGALKNALDWVVGSGEFVNKPVALLNASARAKFAQESLAETIKTMMAQIVPEASLIIPLPTNKIDQCGILASTELSSVLKEAINAFVEAIRARLTILTESDSVILK